MPPLLIPHLAPGERVTSELLVYEREENKTSNGDPFVVPDAWQCEPKDRRLPRRGCAVAISEKSNAQIGLADSPRRPAVSALGHIVLGRLTLDRRGAAIGVDVCSDGRLMELQHMILLITGP
jgi:hypothetical protein